MPSCESKSKIIERFLALCQRSTDKPLGFLEMDEDVHVSPSDPADAVNALRAEIPLEDLLDSGLLAEEEGGSVSLAPPLAGGKSFIVLRDADTGQPFELLTRAGCLAADKLPVFEILRDGRTRQLLEQSSEKLFVAFDLEDVLMLRACGLAATLAVGLDDLPPACVEQFNESFGLKHLRKELSPSHEQIPAASEAQAEAAPEEAGGDPTARSTSGSGHVQAEPVRATLVLLGWAPAELSGEPPAQLPATIEHLQQLERYMDADLINIELWNMDEESVARLRFIAAYGNSTIFKNALHEEAEEIYDGIAGFGEESTSATEPPQDYTTALARLHESGLSQSGALGPNPYSSQSVWRDTRRLLDQQVVTPLRELALTTHNPLRRALLMGCADFSHLFHMQSILIDEQLSRRIADRGLGKGVSLPKDQIRNLTAIADRLIGLAKAAQTCHQPPTTIIETRAIDSTAFPRLPRSD